MEGVLFAREDGTRKLLRGWQKRYFVLSPEDDTALREFAFAADADHHSASGLALARELLLRGATVKTLPFPLAGRPHAFQVVRKGAFRLVLAARSTDELQQWLAALRAAAAANAGGRARSPAAALLRSPSTPWIAAGDLTVGADEFVDVPALAANDAALFAGAHEWWGERVRTTRDVVLSSVMVPRGSVLVAANGISLQTLSTEQVKRLVAKPHGAPLGLRFLRTPSKKGVLKCKVCFSLSTQLRTLAQYRSGAREWTQQVVEVDGDVLTCYPRAEAQANKPRQLLPLAGGCTVKTVHELVAERPFCFMVSVKAHSMLFQARSADEVRSWAAVIQRAIHLAEGGGPGSGQDRLSLDSLQLQSSLNMRSRQSRELFADDADDADDAAPPQPPSTDAHLSTVAHLPAGDLSDMLFFLQRSGRLVEAFQLMGRNTSHRREYWKQIFLWALDPIDDDAFQRLLQTPLVE
ncbi:hypothetical protein PybrP1_002100, partial [[Pythium] brassicae (nom. inval.)]